MIRLLALAVFMWGVAGPAMAAPDVQIDNAWIRAVPPVSPAMAGYFTLTNDGAEPLVLTGGKADFAGMAMLHVMHRDDRGMGAMTHLESITVQPGKSVRFQPGGRHLMLMDLASVPEAGETVTVCLTFQHHPDLCAPFAVRHNAP